MCNSYLSKSKFCKAMQCNKILWLDKNKPEVAEQTAKDEILENGTEVGKLARGIFGEYVNIDFNENLEVMINQTKEQLSKGSTIISEATFCYDNCMCSIDILKNNKSGLEIFEVKSSTEIKDIYIDDISYQVYVLSNLGYKVQSANIVYINNQYERQGELELDKLFNIEDVTKMAMSKQDEIKNKIKEINEYMLSDRESNVNIGLQCSNPYDCEYWNYCTKELPEQNVFSIRRMRKKDKFNLYYSGIYTYKDLLKQDIDWKFKEQIEFDLYNKEPKIEKDNIREFMKELYYPLYFLDFETYQQPIPKYDGIRPYMQIPFQYSLHYIENENGELKHKEFLANANEDPRRKLAERLVNDIPSNVCVLAYNMMFEKMVIKNLAELYNDLSEPLMKIYNNIKDLMIPFKNRMYYTKEMQGSYSIKYVLPALFPKESTLDYHNLSLVHNGSEAMSIFATLGDKSKEEQETIRKALLEYCKLDTLAMVKIWEKLKKV